MSGDDPTPWSIFELSCIVPASFRLTGQRLNAGDLSLQFTERRAHRDGPPRCFFRRRLTVRQIAVAELALRRLPLDRWLAEQERPGGRTIAPPARPCRSPSAPGGPDAITSGRDLIGFISNVPPAAPGVLEGASFAAS